MCMWVYVWMVFGRGVRVPLPVHVEHVEVDEGDLGEKRLAERGGHAGVGLTQPEGRRGEEGREEMRGVSDVCEVLSK